MHPALSVLFFTTASGAGYGLLSLVALLTAAGALPFDRGPSLTTLVVALALIVFGLLASTFHLGHPERAWRAFSQWRSSWLSREGVMAVLTFMPALALLAAWGLMKTPMETLGGLAALAAVLAALGAAATVYCTGQIYASLKTIPQWHHPLVVPVYLGFALASGALCAQALFASFVVEPDWFAALTVLCLLLAWSLKLLYWRGMDRAIAVSSSGTATGLAPLGRVRQLDPPHSEENYVMREMGYEIARKHVGKLRRLALLFGAVLPIALTLLVLFGSGPLAVVAALLAVLNGLLGIFIERWLFFAEATHKVTLFYGAEAV